jgi:Gas vesicle protein
MTVSADSGHSAARGQPIFEQVALVDLLDRVLATGVVVTGDITLSIAGVDLVYVSLHALLSSVRQGGPGPIAVANAEPTEELR